jgi:hypothetical protein
MVLLSYFDIYLLQTQTNLPVSKALPILRQK